MEYFWLFDKHLPSGLGISAFGREHMFWLITAVCCCVAMSFIYARLTAIGKKRMELVVCSMIMLSEAIRWIALICAGVFQVGYLPLHLCGLAVFISMWFALRSGKLAGELLYCLCMPGAACALLFPDWLRYPFLNLLSINSFIAHILLVSYPIMLVSGRRIIPDSRRLPKCALWLLCVAAVIYAFNSLAGTNFMFLSWPSAGSPLVWFDKLLGRPWFILGYIPIIAAVWSLLYLPGVIKRRIRRKSTHKDTNPK